MENIHKMLAALGLEVPADKKADFDKQMKETYRTKVEYDNAVAKGDEYKTSLDTVNEKLKEFEGVSVADLKGQIEKLQGDIKAQADEYAAKEADRVFNDTLSEVIKAAGGCNVKAITALLNVDELKVSKNQSEDIKKAVETAKESDAYLFGSGEPFMNPLGPTDGGGGGVDATTAAMRAAAGLPPMKEK